ncbi:MAG: hypothetical protein K8R21_14885 [Leptospira sp.]|nr:hypothetical protein [Leptospira sp.]
MLKNQTILLLFFLAACSQRNAPSEKEVIEKLIPENGRKNPSVVLTKSANLDETPDLEAIVLVRNGTEEILSVFKKQSSGWEFTLKKSFSLLNIGPIEYDKEKKKWLPTGNQKEREGYIIKRILLGELPGDSFNTIFIEVLSEEPPAGLFSVPYAFRKNKKILDGLTTLKEHENLKKTFRADFLYDEKEKNIKIFPGDTSYAQEFVWNGWELLPDISGVPISALLEVEVKTLPEKNKESEIILNFKNRGAGANVSYLSFGFPDGGIIKTSGDSPGYKIYSTGSPVYSIKEKKFSPAKYPLLEITKEGWGRNYKFSAKFKLIPVKSGAQKILFRTSAKIAREIVSIPNDYSSAETTGDQQGFQAYTIEIGK